MSKNEKKKAGLHKEISSIFKGVVIPGKEGGKESSNTSMLEDTDHAVPTGPAIESQKGEVLKPYQAVQTLLEAESAQESKIEPVGEPKTEPVEEPRIESVEESKTEPVEEPRIESVEESKTEPVEEPRIESVEESKIEPVEEHKVEPVEESRVESVEEPRVESVEEPRVESVEESEPVQTPKFFTAQESKVVPIEESEVESAQESKNEPVSAPKFLTVQDQEAKVIPIEESEVEPTQESETEPDKQPKNEPVHQSKFKKTKKPKVIPVKESKKTGIDKISKKVSEKRSVVKVSSESSWKQITSKLFKAKPGAGGTKQKAMVVMVPVLFIALVIFVLKGGVFGTGVHNAQADEENNNSGVVSANVDNEIDWEVPEAYPTTLRDPIKLGPVVTGTNQTESGGVVDLVVKSILYSEDNPSAIVGSSIVHEGDKIQDASVIKINKDNVEFEMNGKKWTQKIQR